MRSVIHQTEARVNWSLRKPKLKKRLSGNNPIATSNFIGSLKLREFKLPHPAAFKFSSLTFLMEDCNMFGIISLLFFMSYLVLCQGT